MSGPQTAVPGPHIRQSGAVRAEASRELPAEAPVALSFNGSTEAVMMASPADLTDFGVGFALTEGIVTAAEEVLAVEVQALEHGFDVQMRLDADREAVLASRRRKAMGPVGCGLCGIESVEAALRSLPSVATVPLSLTPAEVFKAVASLDARQALRSRTGAVHGAGFWRRAGGLVEVREDVGRHNALDKLVGACTRASIEVGEGALVITSRVSVDIVQKAVVAGAPVLIAVSAPTSLAVETALSAGLTLVAIARGERFEIFSRPDRIAAADGANPGKSTDVA